jgi:hypothetical protein
MEDQNGNFWFSTVFCFEQNTAYDINSALKNPGGRINVTSLGIEDGARTIECRCAEHPQTWIGPDGTI